MKESETSRHILVFCTHSIPYVLPEIPFVCKCAGTIGTFVCLDIVVHVHMVLIVFSSVKTFPTYWADTGMPLCWKSMISVRHKSTLKSFSRSNTGNPWPDVPNKISVTHVGITHLMLDWAHILRHRCGRLRLLKRISWPRWHSWQPWRCWLTDVRLIKRGFRQSRRSPDRPWKYRAFLSHITAGVYDTVQTTRQKLFHGYDRASTEGKGQLSVQKKKYTKYQKYDSTASNLHYIICLTSVTSNWSFSVSCRHQNEHGVWDWFCM